MGAIFGARGAGGERLRGRAGAAAVPRGARGSDLGRWGGEATGWPRTPWRRWGGRAGAGETPIPLAAGWTLTGFPAAARGRCPGRWGCGDTPDLVYGYTAAGLGPPRPAASWANSLAALGAGAGPLGPRRPGDDLDGGLLAFPLRTTGAAPRGGPRERRHHAPGRRPRSGVPCAVYVAHHPFVSDPTEVPMTRTPAPDRVGVLALSPCCRDPASGAAPDWPSASGGGGHPGYTPTASTALRIHCDANASHRVDPGSRRRAATLWDAGGTWAGVHGARPRGHLLAGEALAWELSQPPSVSHAPSPSMRIRVRRRWR